MAIKEARFYDAEDGKVRCGLCPHNCLIGEGKRGFCGIRINKGGTLYTEIYGEVTSVAMDPIEKKPLYHFYPGTRILSIGTKGCNLRCPYCQNWSISQNRDASSSFHSPEEIVKLALDNGSRGIAYTYSEPVVWYEFVYDTAVKARGAGLKNVMVTNGFINPEPLDSLISVIDAMNIDLKCYNEDNYRKIHRGGLEDVKRTIRSAGEAGVRVEVTTLVVTGINDNYEEMMEIAEFIASVDRRIPWHISRYYPAYKYDSPSTDIDFIISVYESASELLDYVFTGNISSSCGGSDTVCPSCNTVVISRSGYHTLVKELREGRCARCGHELGIVHDF